MINKKSNVEKLKTYGVKLLITTFAIIFSGWLLQDGIHIEEPKLLTGLTVAFILLFINMFLKPALRAVISPVSWLSLGFFSLIINASVILLIDKLVDKFTVSSFWYALGFSILVSIVKTVIEVIRAVRVVHSSVNSRRCQKPDDENFSDYEEV